MPSLKTNSKRRWFNVIPKVIPRRVLFITILQYCELRVRVWMNWPPTECTRMDCSPHPPPNYGEELLSWIRLEINAYRISLCQSPLPSRIEWKEDYRHHLVPTDFLQSWWAYNQRHRFCLLIDWRRNHFACSDCWICIAYEHSSCKRRYCQSITDKRMHRILFSLES